MDNEKQRKESSDKWQARADKLESAGKAMQQGGNSMIGCGCLLTVLVTIPILILIFL